jgi:hypothetical protein
MEGIKKAGFKNQNEPFLTWAFSFLLTGGLEAILPRAFGWAEPFFGWRARGLRWATVLPETFFSCAFFLFCAGLRSA